MRKERKKKAREGKKKETARRRGKNNRHLIFLLFVGVKRVILKLLNFKFNAIKCLMKNNNLSCWFWVNFRPKKMCRFQK